MGTGRYTTKGRAKRIQLDYFKRPHPLRRWRLVLSIAASLLAAFGLAGFALRGNQRIYNSGPVSTAHAMFGTQCGSCHVPTAGPPEAGGFFRRPSDQSCSACHAGPIHHENQVGPQTCTSCHVEHQGRVELAALPDRHCTRCHADLKTKDGRPAQFATTVTSFASGHPEFAVTVKDKGHARRIRLDEKAELRDTSQIKLNHEKHVETDLKGVEDVEKATGMRGLVRRDKGLALGCTYCHETDDRRAQMKPIAYARHCAACHPLDFPGRLGDASVPHDRPSVVHAYLRTTVPETLDKCRTLPPGGGEASAAVRKLRKQCGDPQPVKAEAEADTGDRPRGMPGRRAQDKEVAETAPDRSGAAGPGGADFQWQSAESFVFKQRCELCHVMTFAAGQLPEVAPPAIPVRWLPQSVFDHGVHRPVACTECHKAATSKETADVLLPSISVCRECHRGAGGARAGCVECHLHHDKSRERDMDGRFTVEQLVKRRSR